MISRAGLPTLLIAALAAALPRPALPGATPQETVVEILRQRIDQLRVAGELEIGGAVLTASNVLAGLYEGRGFEPIWTDATAASDLVRVIEAIRDDGLEPAHYHAGAIAALARAEPTAANLAALDLLRSDALLRVTHDLRFGKVGRDGAGRNVDRALAGEDALEAILDIIRSGRIYDRVLALRPTHFVYRGLAAALAELRRIEAAGGWQQLSGGPAIRPDSTDPRVPALRARLAITGDLPATADQSSEVVDAELAAAIRRFQHRHGLNEDGIVGPATLAELNVPVARRIDQVRLNMERARWFTHDLPNTFVVANIAGAKVYVVKEGDVVWETRAIVGTAYTSTPVFSAPMRYIDLNPTWTVPPGIVGEILANVRADPDYLRRNDFRVLDRSGRAVDPSTIDFGSYSARSFPYVFQQQPGPANPLGVIKFMFPNPYNVYLHDTPARNLFDREQRTFSHGCIRVQDPLTLAELILDDPVRWNRSQLEAAIATGRTRTIPLENPLPVLVLYWTASADLHGELHFYRDVYRRDEALLRALDQP